MKLHLKRRDYVLALGALVVSALAGFVLQVLYTNPTIDDIIFIELIASAVTVAIIAVGLLTIAKTAQSWGGQMARGLTLVGIGTFYEMIIFIPHVHWHLISEKLAINGGAAVAPWFNISGLWWTGFFHILTALGFVLIGYGFYVMYLAVKPELASLE